MSKHDSSGKRADDRSEQLLSPDAFVPKKSGMGKEIKISLAAITVLLGVLGYVLYGHFFGSAEDEADASVAAAGTDEGQTTGDSDVKTPPSVSYSSKQASQTGTAATAGSSSNLESNTSTAQSQWNNPIRQDRTSAGQAAGKDTSPGFSSYMPSATPRTVQSPTSTPQTSTDRYTGYADGATAGTATGNWPPAPATAPSTHSGQAYDPFQRRTAQEAGSGYASQQYGDDYQSRRQTDSQAADPYERSASSQAYSSDWRYDSHPSAAGAATVASDADTPASSGLGQSGNMQIRTYQQGTSSDYDNPGSTAGTQSTSQYPSDSRNYTGTTGSSVRIQPTSQYSTEGSQHSPDSRKYTTSDPYGYGSGAGSTQVESRTSAQDHRAGTTTSAQRTPSGYSATSASPGYSQSAFPDDDASDGKYTVQPNDTYYSISEKLYGSSSYHTALGEHNRAIFPDINRLDVSKEISVPDVSELERAYPHLCPKPEHRDAMKHRKSAVAAASPPAGANVYVVQEGDTLFDIARYELGKASRWAEIYQLNRDRLGKSFDYLTPGLKLEMPSDQPVGTMTQRPGVSRRY